jgi:EAL domain-containing protein (putative c-di-GMP-specific phosphodiesterase class I)
MLCLELMAKVQCLKFDRHWLSRIDDNAQYQLLSCLIEYGKKTNKLCILEGVETKAHLITARKLKVDLVQGFLFTAAFNTVKQSEPCLG